MRNEICPYCEEAIQPDDLRGLHSLTDHHYECSIRIVAGSLAHLERRCSCYGGTGDDDPKLSVRANARLACVKWHADREGK